MAENNGKTGKYRASMPAQRGQTIRTETGRDRSDDYEGVREALNAEDDLKGDVGDISHSIVNGRVPRDA